MLFIQIQHTTSLSQANSIHIQNQIGIFQLRRVFQTQVPISLVILVIGIQDLYTSKYKYTINADTLENGVEYTHKYQGDTNHMGNNLPMHQHFS